MEAYFVVKEYKDRRLLSFQKDSIESCKKLIEKIKETNQKLSKNDKVIAVTIVKEVGEIEFL